jgi:DNA repair photolyase
MAKTTGTKEWSTASINIIDGCSHDCRYCYAHAMKQRFHQLNGHSWSEEKLKGNIDTLKIRKVEGRIMYPSAHDITPEFIEAHIIVVRRMLDAGNTLLIVSKPHKTCVTRICDEFIAERDRITFRFSIGSIDNAVLSFWEPGAPHFDERFECLKITYFRGFQTSISVEPMLEGDLDALIAAVTPFVTDTIWLGKINRLKSNLTFNGYNGAEMLTRAESLIASQSDVAIKAIYDRHKNNLKMRFKESIKKVVGIQLSAQAGLDI